MKPRGDEPSSYGWVVVASAFFTMGLTAGVLKNFGHFFLDIQSHFAVQASTTSWVTSTTIAMLHLGAPAANALSLRFSHRAIVVLGGLLAASGMLLACKVARPGHLSHKNNGRLYGWIANTRLLRNLQLLAVAAALLGVALLLLPISQNYWAMLVFASLCGLLFGCVVAIHVTGIVGIVTLQGFDSGLGLFMLLRSIGGFAGPPAAGRLLDHTNNYSSTFHLSGVCLLVSAAFVVLVDRLVQRRTKAPESNVSYAVNQQEGRETAEVQADTPSGGPNADIS